MGLFSGNGVKIIDELKSVGFFIIVKQWCRCLESGSWANIGERIQDLSFGFGVGGGSCVGVGQLKHVF